VLEGVDAQTALEVAEGRGMEGVIAKRRDAPYRPGRSGAWVKTPLWRTTEAVIGGWAEGRGRHAGAVGAVLSGLPTPSGHLRYIGHVGTGSSPSGVGCRPSCSTVAAGRPASSSPMPCSSTPR
jgi:bifunctional non-homologous end joining protein LigD